MSMTVRTTLAALAVTLAAGASAALAAPVASLANQPSLVMPVVDDSTSENDAIAIERNEAPAVADDTKSHMAPMLRMGPSDGDNETKQIQQEREGASAPAGGY
jgi:hypothetical protein